MQPDMMSKINKYSLAGLSKDELWQKKSFDRRWAMTEGCIYI